MSLNSSLVPVSHSSTSCSPLKTTVHPEAIASYCPAGMASILQGWRLFCRNGVRSAGAVSGSSGHPVGSGCCVQPQDEKEPYIGSIRLVELHLDSAGPFLSSSLSMSFIFSCNRQHVNDLVKAVQQYAIQHVLN